jgi:hypothetical protein
MTDGPFDRWSGFSYCFNARDIWIDGQSLSRLSRERRASEIAA